MKKETIIPKIIHYCWFGPNEKPELVLKCIESWKKYLPEYEFDGEKGLLFEYKGSAYRLDVDGVTTKNSDGKYFDKSCLNPCQRIPHFAQWRITACLCFVIVLKCLIGCPINNLFI